MEKRERIYLAGSFSRCAELNNYAQELRDLGYVVDCRWLNGSHQFHPGAEKVEAATDMPPEAAAFALDDWEDLQNSGIVISFTGGPGSTKRGGRHVEFGMAIAYNKRPMLVGPRENVFHALPSVEQFYSWEECRNALI